MGAAQCTLTNDTEQGIRIYSFNYSDGIRSVEYEEYWLEPHETKEIKAALDARGLIIATGKHHDELHMTCENGGTYQVSDLLRNGTAGFKPAGTQTTAGGCWRTDVLEKSLDDFSGQEIFRGTVRNVRLFSENLFDAIYGTTHTRHYFNVFKIQPPRGRRYYAKVEMLKTGANVTKYNELKDMPNWANVEETGGIPGAPGGYSGKHRIDMTNDKRVRIPCSRLLPALLELDGRFYSFGSILGELGKMNCIYASHRIMQISQNLAWLASQVLVTSAGHKLAGQLLINLRPSGETYSDGTPIFSVITGDDATRLWLPGPGPGFQAA